MPDSRTPCCHASLKVSNARVTTGPTAAGRSPSTLVPLPPQPNAAILAVKGIRPPVWLKLAPLAKKQVQPYFDRFGWDLGRLTFSTGRAFGQAGITFGRTILLERAFGLMDYQTQLGLLAHEIAHSLQYHLAGWGTFLTRYLGEWRKSDGDPYMKEGDSKWEALADIPIGSVDALDPRFYLDQIADRFRVAVEDGE